MSRPLRSMSRPPEPELEPRPRPQPGGQSLSGSRELKARSLRLIRTVATALGKMRMQAGRAIQVARAAIAQPAPKPPLPMPVQAAAVSRGPQRRQEDKETLRIVLPETIEIHAGWSKQVPISAYRNGLDGPVTIQFEGVPPGVSLPPVIMPTRSNRAAASLRAEIEVRSVQVRLRVTACCGPRQTERPVTLIVHANPSLAFRSQGYRLLASGQPAQAIAAFSRALEIAAGDPIVLNNRGVAHAQLGQLASAVADYSAAIRLSPGDAVARYNRGVALARQQNITRALLDLDTAIRLRPNYAPAYRSRAELYERSGNPRTRGGRSHEGRSDHASPDAPGQPEPRGDGHVGIPVIPRPRFFTDLDGPRGKLLTSGPGAVPSASLSRLARVEAHLLSTVIGEKSIMGRDEQLGKEQDQPESRQETARGIAQAEQGDAKTELDPRPPDERQAKADLLKSSGGDPLTQEND